MSNSLLIENRENARIVTFNRPEIRSPLSIFVIEEIDAIIDDFISSGRKKIIFTGRDEVFASGADLREIAMLKSSEAREFALRGQNLMKKISEMPRISIAAVNGFCFGGALDLALACRYRVAAPAARFCHPGANLGIVTGWGGTQRLPRLIGAWRALEMFLTAKVVDANEALASGLIDKISDDAVAESLANFD